MGRSSGGITVYLSLLLIFYKAKRLGLENYDFYIKQPLI